MTSSGKNTIRSALANVKTIEIVKDTSRVQRTAAEYLQQTICTQAEIIEKEWSFGTGKSGTLRIANNAGEIRNTVGFKKPAQPEGREWLYVQLDESGSGYMLASGFHYLYALVRHVTENLIDRDITEFQEGTFFDVTFTRNRLEYDHFVNQHARTAKYIGRDEHFANLARAGFSHAEVNGIPSPIQFETGPKGEVLHRFYTYCHALDQYVSSKLNKGIYKEDYLLTNLNYFKSNAAFAEKYGLTPGMVCFEPRSVPDALLERYPMLRGARVDHPLRSFKPRYNLSIAHPVVQDHYAEMMEKLVREVPALDYIAIYSNDSGAGFEYTNSLYVGRNGGGYVIREWKGDKEIAEAAALNLVRFLKILRDAGRIVNPDFRVILRFEAFAHELDHIFANLDNGIDLEAGSFKSTGWELSYKHPKYDDVPEIHLTALHNKFDAGEKDAMAKLQEKGVSTEVYYTPDVLWNHEPLTGIPFPYLIYEKLKEMSEQDVTSICHLGGVTPPSYVSHNINQEILRAFQFDSNCSIDDILLQKAEQWVGPEYAQFLFSLWQQSDDIFRSTPIPVWLYNGWANWYRILIRPIVPNIEAISEEDRAYYENHLLATAHNRARIDFRYDVGFELTDQPKAQKNVQRMDAELFPRMEKTLSFVDDIVEKTKDKKCGKHFIELRDRLTALKCFFRSQRNVAAWITGVHGYLETNDDDEKKECRTLLHDMVLDEIENTKQLLKLWETSDTRWMYYSAAGETTFIYGDNFGDHLRRKIELMTGRENDEPQIDPEFQWRVPGIPWSYKNSQINLNEAL